VSSEPKTPSRDLKRQPYVMCFKKELAKRAAQKVTIEGLIPILFVVNVISNTPFLFGLFHLTPYISPAPFNFNAGRVYHHPLKSQYQHPQDLLLFSC